MKGAIVFGAGVVAFLFGALAYDLKHPSEAEAGGGGIGLTCGTGTGGAVCTASPTLTGTLTAAGISAVTGAFSGSVTVTGTSGTTGLWITQTGAATAYALGVASNGTNPGGIFAQVNATGGTAIVAQATAGNSSGVSATASGSGNAILGTSASNSSGSGVKGIGATLGTGVWASNTSGSGYAIYIEGDATSPSFAPGRILVADTAPSTLGAAGDFYVHTGGIFRLATAASGVWVASANGGIKATVAAAGTTQGTATAITAGSDFYQATGADATKGITLTQGGAGTAFRIMNASTSTLKVYGHNSDSDTINGTAGSTAFVMPANVSLLFHTADGTAWLTY